MFKLYEVITNTQPNTRASLLDIAKAFHWHDKEFDEVSCMLVGDKLEYLDGLIIKRIR